MDKKGKILSIVFFILFLLVFISIFVVASDVGDIGEGDKEKNMSSNVPTSYQIVKKTPYTTEYYVGNGIYRIYETKSVQNVFEDGIWKDKRKARSLMNKTGFKVNFKEIDNNFNVRIIDYNWTSARICLKTKEINKDIPFEVYKNKREYFYPNGSKIKNISQINNFEDKLKNREITSEIVRDLKEINLKEDSKLSIKSKESKIKFLDDKEKCFNVDLNSSILNKNFKFGFNSTEWTYQEDANATRCANDAGKSWDATQTCAKVYDGDWDTAGIDDTETIGSPTDDGSYVYFNYTKPSGSLSSSNWQVKYSSEQITVNHTMSDYLDCWDQDPLQFHLKSTAYSITASFPEGTMVMTKKGLVDIKDINVGDIVLSFDTNKQKINYAKVLDTISGESLYYEILAVDDIGKFFSINVTSNHLFLTKNNEFVSVKDMKINDSLYVFDGEIKEVKIFSIIPQLYGYVYDIKLDRNYLFFANKFVVHNSVVYKIWHRCWDGSSWHQIFSDSSATVPIIASIYEEAMNWDLGYITIDSPTENQIFNIEDESVNFNITTGEMDTCYWSDNYNCYQESANVSTSCGGLDSGVYGDDGNLIDVNNAYDGDWSTVAKSSSTQSGYIYINYTKPSGVLSSSKWQVKDQGTTTNLTIDSLCWSQPLLQLRAYAMGSGALASTEWDCYNGTGWKNLRTQPFGTGSIYEEAMIWDFGNSTLTKTNSTYFHGTNDTFSDGSHTIKYLCNETDGTWRESSTVTFTSDFNNPSITVNYPSNSTNYSTKTVNINSTILDTNLETCWYSNNSGQTNNTFTCGTNLTGDWEEGLNVIYVYANDSAGNTNNTEHIAFTVDTTPPTSTPTMTSPPDGASYTNNTWTKNNVKVTITASDSGVGYDNLAYPKYCWDTTNTCTPNTYISSGTTNTTEGILYIRFNSTDRIGNSETIQSRTVKIDKSAPSLTISSPINASNYSSTSVNINYTYSDTYSGMNTCWWSNQSGNINHTITCGTNITGHTWEEGLNTIYVYANDSLGNENNSEIITFTVDTTNPAVSIIYPTNGTYHNSKTVYVNYTYLDSGIGVDTCLYSNDSWVTNNTFTCGNNLTGDWEEGLNTIYLAINDSVGNLNNSETISFYVDTTYPQINFTGSSDSNNTWDLNGNAFINVTASDTNKDSVRLDWNGANETFDNSEGNYYWENKTGLSTGTYTYSVWINDSAGNLNQTETRTIKIDNEDPTITIEDPKEQSYNTDTDLNINIIASDTNLDSCWYNEDDGTNYTFTCSQNTTFNSSEGNHRISVYANDSSGRVNNNSVQFSVSLDPPSTSLDYPDDDAWFDSSTITFNYTPSDSTLDSCEFYINSSGGWHLNKTETSPINQSENNFTITIEEGTFIWNVWCNDSANNGEWANPLNNRTVNVDITYPLISFDTAPDDNTNSTATNIYINVSVTELNEANITFRLHNSAGSYNITTFADGTREINWTSLPDANYTYNVTITDEASNINYTEIRRITLDDTKPTLSIDEPQAQNYANYQNLSLNYSAIDNLMGMEECWYYVYNRSDGADDSLIISTTTLSSCQNTTFNLSAGDVDYTLYLFGKDKVDNIQSTSVIFGIRTGSPAISLIPSNNTHVPTTNDSSFNFTVSTNADSIDTCRLWLNDSKSWYTNQTLTTVSTTSTNEFNTLNLTEATILWTVWCNDSLNNTGWALNNQSFTVDMTYPKVNIDSSNITTTTGSQTFNFDAQSSDLHTLSCKYSIFKSDGTIDGLNENVSYTCNSVASATTTAYGTFNLTVYAEDLAGNENSSTDSFTTSASVNIPSGGGGGATPEPKSEAVCLVDKNITKVTELQTCILYARILESVEGKTFFALTSEKLGDLRKKLIEQGVELTFDELNKYIEVYNNQELVARKILDSDINKYSLFTGVVQIKELAFAVNPKNLDPFYSFIISEKPKFEYLITSNRELKNVSIIEGELGISAELTGDTTAKIILEPVNLDFSSKTFKAKANYISVDGNSVFQSINLRVINFRNILMIITIGGVFLIGVFLYLTRKKIRKVFIR